MKPRSSEVGSSAQRERVLRACAKLPGVELTYPFGEGTAVFKVGDRMFAVAGEDEEPSRLTLKCDPDYGTYLTQQFDDIVPGYHMNKRHWITITLVPRVSKDLIDDLISNSYDLIVAALPAHAREALESHPRG